MKIVMMFSEKKKSFPRLKNNVCTFSPAWLSHKLEAGRPQYAYYVSMFWFSCFIFTKFEQRFEAATVGGVTRGRTYIHLGDGKHIAYNSF